MLEINDLPLRLRRVNLKADSRSEKEIYDAELKDCTHSVSAVGYDMNPSLRIHVDGSEAEPTFYSLTGKFFWAKGSQGYLDELFGAGIASPERVTDSR